MYIREKNDINPITPYLWFIATHPADNWLQTYTRLHNQVPQSVVLNSVEEIEKSFLEHKENEGKQLKAAIKKMEIKANQSANDNIVAEDAMIKSLANLV